MFGRLKKLIYIYDPRNGEAGYDIDREMDSRLVFTPYWAWGFGIEWQTLGVSDCTNYNYELSITYPLVGVFEFRFDRFRSLDDD